MRRPYRSLLAIASIYLSATPAWAQHKMVDTKDLAPTGYHIYGKEIQITGPEWQINDLRRRQSSSVPTISITGENGIRTNVPLSQVDGMKVGGALPVNAGNPMVDGLNGLAPAGFQANAPSATVHRNLPNGTTTGIHGQMDAPKPASSTRNALASTSAPASRQPAPVVAKYEQQPISSSSSSRAVPSVHGTMLTPTERLLQKIK